MNYKKIYDKQLVELYVSNNDKFYVGYIEFENEEQIMLKIYQKLGFFDGYLAILKEDISKISINTEYLKDMKILIETNLKEKILDSFIFKGEELVNIKSNNLLMTLLQELLEKNILCSIEVVDEDNVVYGYIEEIIQNEFVKIKYFDEENLVKIEDISDIFLSNIYERKEEFLVKRRANELR